MNKLDRHLLFLGDSCHVHQTGRIRTVTYSAPVAMWRLILSSPIRVETAGSSIENIPPNPQHSSLRSGSWMVIPSTIFNKSMILLKGLMWLLRRRRQSQFAHTVATVVYTHHMRELARHMIHLQHIVKELHNIHDFL